MLNEELLLLWLGADRNAEPVLVNFEHRKRAIGNVKVGVSPGRFSTFLGKAMQTRRIQLSESWILREPVGEATSSVRGRSNGLRVSEERRGEADERVRCKRMLGSRPGGLPAKASKPGRAFRNALLNVDRRIEIPRLLPQLFRLFLLPCVVFENRQWPNRVGQIER